MKLPEITSVDDCIQLIKLALKELETRDPNQMLVSFETKFYIVKSKTSE